MAEWSRECRITPDEMRARYDQGLRRVDLFRVAPRTTPIVRKKARRILTPMRATKTISLERWAEMLGIPVAAMR